MVRWHKGTGYFPVLNTSVKVLEWQNWFDRNPAYRAAFDQLLQSKANRATQGALIGPFPEIRTIIENMIQEVFQGKDIDKALKDADAKADKALQQYNASVGK